MWTDADTARKEKIMEITYEVELNYGDDGPGEDEPSPTADDIAAAVRKGLEGQGFAPADVRVVQL